MENTLTKAPLNVLIVDDDENLTEIIRNYLIKYNCKITAVATAENAAQLLAEYYFDLFIIDIRLAGVVDGLKLLHYIKREMNLDSEVIMISGNLTIKNAIEAIRLGAYDLFEKPFALSKLNSVIDTLYERKIIKRIPLNVIGVYRHPYSEEMNKNYNILVVDDEDDIRMLVTLILEEQKFNVMAACDVIEAEKLIKQNRPDLILLDIMLPGEDGYSFGKRLKTDERFFDIPILMFSSKSKENDIKKGIDVCADDYLTKPFTNTILISKIKALLRMRNIIDEMKIYTDQLLQKISRQDSLRKYLSKETLFFTQLNKTLELDGRSNLIKQYLPDILDFELFSLFLLDGDELKIFSHNHNEIANSLKISELKNSPMVKAIETKLPVLLEDYKQTEFYKGKTRDKYKKKSSLIYPLVIHNNVIGVLNMNNKIAGEFDILFVEHATRVIEHIANSIENCQLFQKMEEMAIYDGLTQIYNRRHFFSLLAAEIKKSERYKHCFCILLMDLDNFKKFNDTLGHLTGDKALKKFADIVKESIRETDMFGRYGGEEFIVLFNETDIELAKTIAERIRKNIEEKCIIEVDNKTYGVTLSAGLIEFSEGMSIENILAGADKYLYNAKKRGKNIIITGETYNAD